MSITEILYNLLLMPLQMLFEFVFNTSYFFIGNLGLTIIVFSLLINFLILPLYRRADALQEEERRIEQRLSRGVQHIKRTFHGDEQTMMLQTYYRQNGYKPTYVLRGASSLMLEIPFFIVAYRFLSNLDLLQGASFGPISNLGKPDGMLVIAGVTVNVLPLIMTAINLVSSYLFTRGYPRKTKVQLYGMALFFLVFLYNSPAGLVFYWTLNNAFSLVKTIFYKLKEPRKVLAILTAILGVGAFVPGITVVAAKSAKWALLFCGGGMVLILPALLMLLRDKKDIIKKERTYVSEPKLFYAGAAFLVVLTGLVIPSSIIASSPQEFMIIGYLNDPIWYVVSSFCLAVGTFVVWLGVFYSLADQRGRYFIEQTVWVLCGVAIVDYMFFGRNMGLISSTLQYEKEMVFTAEQQFINLVVLMGTAAVMWLVHRCMKKNTVNVAIIATLALCGLVTVNVSKINKSVSQVSIPNDAENKEQQLSYSLSKNGKNVIVLMLDRALGEYIPYIMNEKPELKEQFDGFTYYSNTISYGICTNIGAPGLFGGYEYTPLEINKRDDEALVSKHNEALKVMPVLFDQNNYNVTVCQPVYAGYSFSPDLSIYDDYADIKAYRTTELDDMEMVVRPVINGNMRNFFAFGIMKTVPLIVQPWLYQYGHYNWTSQAMREGISQTRDGIYYAIGINPYFSNYYNILSSLPSVMSVTEEAQNTFLMMVNDTTHTPTMLQMPDYTLSKSVDNSAYADQFENGYAIDGKTLKMENAGQIMHYQVNMAAMLKLGEWFDYLRENGVYDNTRIILVSDHGQNTLQLDEAVFDLGGNDEFDSEWFRPLLMVKDFNATGFATSDEFMTNADTPTLALEGLIDDPVNPFTGKVIDNSKKTAHEQYVFYSDMWSVYENNGNVFMPGDWYAVYGDTWNADNWRIVASNTTSPAAAG